MARPRHLIKSLDSSSVKLINDNFRKVTEELSLDNFKGQQINTGTVQITQNIIQAPIIATDGSELDGAYINPASVTAEAINVDNLSALSANMGDLTSGTITLDNTGHIKGGQTDYNTGEGFFLGYDTDAYKFSIGDPDNNKGITWDGEDFIVKGGTIQNLVAESSNSIAVNDGASINVNDGGDILMRSDETNPAEIRFYTAGDSGNYISMCQTSIPGNLVDSHTEVGASSAWALRSGSITAVGQSFTNTTAGKITECKFYIRKYGSPTGNITAKLYAHSGVFGTTSKPTGAVLATSDNVDITTISSTASLVSFTFTGAEQYSMSSSTNYVLTINYSGGDATNLLYVQYHYLPSGGTNHSGNCSNYITTWTSNADRDLSFFVFNDTPNTASTAITFDASDGAINPHVNFNDDITLKANILKTSSLNNIIYVDGEKYTTIQDAIDDLPAGGGTVIIPEGTYTISSGISRDISNVTIKGSGRSTIINTTSAITVLTAGDFWTIEDLYIKGNNTGTQDGIRVDGKSGVTIQGCIIEDMGRYGIYGVGSASTTINKIINNQIIDCDYNVIVSNPSTRWLIRGNISRDSNYDGIYYRGHNAVISDNHCFDNGRQGIALEGRVTATTYSCDYNIITNNICDNNAHSGLHIENDCNYNTIIGNISINNTLYGMNVATSTCEYNNIINNTLLNNDSANWNDTSIGSYNNWKDNIGITIRCKAYLNTSTQDNIATGTQTHVLLNAEVYDTGSNFNTSTSTFTAPLDGYYNITGSVGWVTGTIIADKRWFTAIRVNDVEKTAGNQHSSHTGSIVANCTDRLYLAAGDTVKLYAFHDGGAATPDINTGQNVTFLTIDYVGSY